MDNLRSCIPLHWNRNLVRAWLWSSEKCYSYMTRSVMNYDRKESENLNECEAEKRMCEPKYKNECEQIWNIRVCVCQKKPKQMKKTKVKREREREREWERDPYSSLSWPRALWATEWKQTAAGLKLSLNDIRNSLTECKLREEEEEVEEEELHLKANTRQC